MAQHDYSKKEVLDIVEQVARQKGIPVDDFMRFAHIETGGTFNEQAHNKSSGAKGLFQFVPSSAETYGLKGHEFDPTRNTQAAAQMYQDNLASMAKRNERTGNPYLSGGDTPSGLDLYLAHQQGSAGYGSVQTALATGTFGVVRNGAGEVIDMRRNVLNQIGSDVKALTGHSKAEMTGMNDGDLARSFSQYYTNKYAAIAIPEKNISAQGPSHATPAPVQTPAAPSQAQVQAVGAGAAAVAGSQPAAAQPGIALRAAYDAGVKYDHVEYAINIPGHKLYHPGATGKNVEQGYIDCSGWVGTLQNRTMDEINRKAGHDVFGKADRIDLGNTGSGGIVHQAFKESGVLLNRADIMKPGALQEGMVIGLDTAKTQHEHWKGIDHIVMVVRDPNTDKLLISQSSGSKGVHTMPVEDYLKQVENHPNWKIFASDPLSKGRNLLESHTQDRVQGHDAASQEAAGKRGHAQPEAASHGGLLKDGSKGDAVRNVQEELNKLGYTGANGKPLGEDGHYGKHTQEAVRAFQRDNGLGADGIVGPKTLGAIGEARDKPMLSDPRHPSNPMFEQAVKGMEGLEAGTFKDRQALLNAAGALTQDARSAGLQRIDSVVPSTNGQILFAVQGGAGDPVQLRAHVEKGAAETQSLAATSAALQQPQQDQQQEQARQTQKAMGH